MVSLQHYCLCREGLCFWFRVFVSESVGLQKIYWPNFQKKVVGLALAEKQAIPFWIGLTHYLSLSLNDWAFSLGRINAMHLQI